MNQSSEFSQQVALFRYSIISPLLHLPAHSAQIRQTIEQIAHRTHTIPGSRRTHIAPGTVRDWLRQYRHGGLDALRSRPRKDRGKPRVLPPEVVELLLSTKENNPQLSVRLVIAEARKHPSIDQALELPVSTVHRLFTRYGLMAPQSGDPSHQDRRRFAYRKAGHMWQSDVMHGPSVLTEGKRRRKTYLIAFIDDATRVVPYAAFALSENTQAFLPVLKQAIVRRGLPERLFVDNGSNYRSTQVALVCAKLNMALIHAAPYSPTSKGKIERFFRTLRAQFLTRLTDEDTQSLEALNRRLHAYIEGEYHQTPHHGLDGQTPLDYWAQHGDEVHYLDPQLDLDDLFLAEATRKVKNDRTVSLNGVIYEVDAVLVGEQVTLRFDASRQRAPVQVIHEGKFIELARVVDLYANCRVKRQRPSPSPDSEPSGPAPSNPLSMHKLKRRNPDDNH